VRDVLDAALSADAPRALAGKSLRAALVGIRVSEEVGVDPERRRKSEI
jgi:hypothetical protein